MPKIQPFAGWRFDPATADYALTSMPPYSLVDDQMQEFLYKRNDLNAVRIINGREFASDSTSDNRYTRSAAHLNIWREDGVFIKDKPSIYVYEQNFKFNCDDHTRRGFFSRILLSEWETDGIFPHKKPRIDMKNDRLKLMQATSGNCEPVFALLTDPSADISRTLYQMCKYEPLASFTSDDGARNHFWVMDNLEQAGAFCAGCSQESIFIADGHNRYEAALAYRNEIREAMKAAGQTPPALGELDSDYCMVFIVPDSDPGLFIQPSHYTLHNLAESMINTLTDTLKKNFTVEKMGDIDKLLWKIGENQLPAFGLAINNELYFAGLGSATSMDLRAPDKSANWRGLDSSALNLLVFEDILGVNEQNHQQHISTTHELELALEGAKSKSGGTQCAVIMRPPTLDQLRNLSRSGEAIPRTSASFFPKILSGLVFNFFS